MNPISRSIQVSTFEYFKDRPDSHLYVVTNAVCYEHDWKDKRLTKIVDDFLIHMECKEAFENYKYDETKESIWRKATMSDRQMLDYVQQALMNAIYNKWKANVDGKI